MATAVVSETSHGVEYDSYKTKYTHFSNCEVADFIEAFANSVTLFVP